MEERYFESIAKQSTIEMLIYYVEDIIRKEEPFSEWQIRNIHQLILKDIDDENAERYRQQNVLISGATSTPSDYTLLIRWLS